MGLVDVPTSLLLTYLLFSMSSPILPHLLLPAYINIQTCFNLRNTMSRRSGLGWGRVLRFCFVSWHRGGEGMAENAKL